MFRATLYVTLIVCVAMPAFAADVSTASYEGSKTRELSALPVSELLAKAAKSPLRSGEAHLLRAVADLIDKEQTAVPQDSDSADPNYVAVALPAPAVVPATHTVPVDGSEASELRTRLVFRLRNAPVVDVAEALEDYLENERKIGRANGSIRDADRVAFVPERLTNSLLISGTREDVDSLSELIAELDAEHEMVQINVCIAELLPPPDDDHADDNANGHAGMEDVPDMEKDGAEWLAWANNHGRLQFISRPRITTMVNQPATCMVGTMVSIRAPHLGAGDAAKEDQIKRADVGLTVSLTPRITPDELIVMELDVEHTRVMPGQRAAGTIIGRTGAQTTISAKAGRTVVLAGLPCRADDEEGSFIIALTPQIKPTR